VASSSNKILQTSRSTSDSVSLDSSIIEGGLRVFAEYCRNSFDENISDSSPQVNDIAWKTRLSGNAGSLEWDFSTAFEGREFKTIDNPYSGGMMKYHFNSTYQIERTAFRISGLQSESQTARFKMLNFGALFSGRQWSISPNFSLQSLEDNSAREDGVDDTVTVKLASAIRPSHWLNICPSLSYTANIPGYFNSEFLNCEAMVESDIQVLPDTANLNTSFSFIDNRTDKNSSFRTVSAESGISFRLKNNFIKEHAKSLGIKGRYALTSFMNNSKSEMDYSVQATLRIGLPSGLASRPSKNDILLMDRQSI